MDENDLENAMNSLGNRPFYAFGSPRKSVLFKQMIQKVVSGGEAAATAWFGSLTPEQRADLLAEVADHAVTAQMQKLHAQLCADHFSNS